MIKTIASVLNKLLLHSRNDWKDIYSGIFLLVRILKEENNTIKITGAKTSKSIFQITGTGNSIISEAELIEESQIVINGQNNSLKIAKGVKLRKANIIIRGSNCHITIGSGTTFGGVRIVNVGTDNLVEIGENCLFSDQIEIWASDTHSIFNEDNQKINKEQPVFIGDNVWVGSRVIILKGIEISDGAIIGMGTIVSRNIPSKTISVGIPNKVIKENVRWTNEY
jgi:acetyltransferase-like isoleucine patch superfamily enzyme